MPIHRTRTPLCAAAALLTLAAAVTAGTATAGAPRGAADTVTAARVQTTTLDALVKAYGLPAFVKIDVEGGELNVLRGLSQPVPALSFEFLPAALDAAEACIRQVETLGRYQFNWSIAESSELAHTEWVDGTALLQELRQSASSRHGDIYARRLAL